MNETVLDKILTAKRLRIDESKRSVDIVVLSKIAFDGRKLAESNRLRSVLRNPSRINIIAEIKRASPSKGVINDALDVADIARIYERGGAAAISVLTEEDHFHGSLDDLRAVCNTVEIPVLQKDFFFDEFQIFESAAAGADAILLIVAALPPTRLLELQKVANDLGMDAIVEVHDTDELEIAFDIGAKIIGVNNRNLKNFDVSLDVSRELIIQAPKDVVMISESGISNGEQIADLRELGYAGFLIGETLMRSGDPEAKLRDLNAFQADVLEFNTTQKW
jgi:indole-3-glycerol phosphate synthase